MVALDSNIRLHKVRIRGLMQASRGHFLHLQTILRVRFLVHRCTETMEFVRDHQIVSPHCIAAQAELHSDLILRSLLFDPEYMA